MIVSGPWRRRTTPQQKRDTCASCSHFNSDAAHVEAAFPGLTAMGSAFSSVRMHDGLCGLRDVYLPFYGGCADWTEVGSTDE